MLTRIKGRMRRYTIGRHGSPWTPETARKRANELLHEIGSGGDPIARQKADRVRGMTLAAVLDLFVEQHLSKLKPKTQVTYRSLVDVNLRPVLGTRLISEIAAKDVNAAHTKWAKTSRVTANNALAVLSKVMSWAEEQEYRTEGSNPCSKVKRFRINGRERYLDDAEMTQLGEAMRRALHEGENAYMVAAIGVLILTGARKSEVLDLKCSEVDAVRGHGRLQDSKTGSKTMPLNAEALAIIGSLPRIEGNPFVFAGEKPGDPISTVQHVWEKVRTWAKLPDVRLQDLRHSFASFAGDAGGSLPMVGRILGHSDSRTTQRYVHFFDRTARTLAGQVGGRIGSALGVLDVGTAIIEKKPEGSDN